MYEAIAMHPRASEPFIITKGKKTATKVLEKLAKDTHQSVRIAVVKNPKTSIETIEAIAKANKYDLMILKYLLERAPDRAEKYLLEQYEFMKNGDLRSLILQHPAAPINSLKNKLHLLSWFERYTITQHYKTSQEMLEILAKDANRIVRAAAKETLLNFYPPNPP